MNFLIDSTVKSQDIIDYLLNKQPLSIRLGALENDSCNTRAIILYWNSTVYGILPIYNNDTACLY